MKWPRSTAQPWYEIRAESSDVADVWVYDVIGEDFFGEGVSAKNLCRELSQITAERINLHVNSPGGNVFDGQAIYNALRRHPASVTTYVEGFAGSIATVVALAGDKVVMAANSLWMIHDPFGCACGSAAELRAYADVLDKAEVTIAGVYVEHTGRERAEIDDAMANETWFSADEAKDFGFVDTVGEPLKVAAMAWNFAELGYRTPPPGGAVMIGNDTTPEAAEATSCRELVFVPGHGYYTLAKRI